MNPAFSSTFFSVLLVLRLASQPRWDHCPFTSGFCNWQNVDDVDAFNWTLHSGCTSSNYTGPNCHQGNKNKLTLKLLERLDRCYAEVHYGTVHDSLLLAITRLRRKLGLWHFSFSPKLHKFRFGIFGTNFEDGQL